MLRGCVQRVLTPEIDRAAIRLLNRLGAEVVLVAPPTLMPAGVATWGVRVTHDFDEALAEAVVSGYSFREVAQAAGVAPNSVSPRLARSALLAPT